MSVKKLFAVIGCLVATSAFAQQESISHAPIETIPVGREVYMLAGGGGNIGLFAGGDGVMLIGVQYASLTDKIRKAVSTVTDQPVRLLVNTHWHGDRTSTKDIISNHDTIIVAQDNARKRMAKGLYMKAFNVDIPPAPPEALPVMTFSERLTFYWNRDKLDIFHLPSAHSDGDAVVYFDLANIVYTGDVFFNGMYPFIDSDSGGTMQGLIAAVDTMLERTLDNTKIIPGHGPLGSKADLKAYRDMLATVQGKMTELIEAGKTIDEIVAAKPTADYDATWGNGLLTPDQWVSVAYAAMRN